MEELEPRATVKSGVDNTKRRATEILEQTLDAMLERKLEYRYARGREIRDRLWSFRIVERRLGMLLFQRGHLLSLSEVLNHEVGSAPSGEERS